MSASTAATFATVAVAGAGTFLLGPGAGVLAAILGTVLVVVLATREQNALWREAERRERLREAARARGAGR